METLATTTYINYIYKKPNANIDIKPQCSHYTVNISKINNIHESHEPDRIQKFSQFPQIPTSSDLFSFKQHVL